MKILLLSEIFPPEVGGSGRWFWEIYSRMPREDVYVAAGMHEQSDAFDATHDLQLERVISRPGNWEWIGQRGLLAYLRAIKNVRRIVRSQNIDVIHCGRILPEGVIANAVRILTGVPFSCYVHGEDITWAKASREHTFLIKQTLKRCQYIIANSQNSADLLINEWGFPESRIHVLHPGVDTTYFQPVERSASVRSELGWGERPVILTVGRLMRRKGHDILITALKEVVKEIPDVLYSIVGGGSEHERLQKIVDDLGLNDNVEFRGETTDQELLDCYQQCDLFALPNRQHEQDIEGFGMVLVEAQSCGKPVIAGDSGGTSETMKIGETGFIVDCTSPEILAAKVTSLLRDQERLVKMGTAARQFVVEHFDWQALSQKAQRVFIDESAS